MCSGEAQGFGLEYQTQAVNFLDVFWLEADDEHSAAGNVYYQPLFLKLLEGLPNWRPADLKLSRQLALIESLTGSNPPGKDRTADGVSSGFLFCVVFTNRRKSLFGLCNVTPFRRPEV